MKWRRSSWLLFALAAVWVAAGCGGGKPSGVGITVSPTAASAITSGPTVAFSALITGAGSSPTATWAIACESGVTAGTCGSITPTTTTGSGTVSYSAPATVPTTTSNGTTTAAPTVTITATAQADTNQHASATITIVSGITVTITPTTATVGTNEHFTFTATVTNPGCSLTIDPTCDNVTWSVTSTQSHAGMIGTTGVYTADPSTVPSPSSVTIQAKSVKDQTVTATATVSVVTAGTPTVTSVSPNTVAAGGLFQDVDITGTNFISTDQVYINCPAGTAPTSSSCTQLNPTNVTQVTTATIRARIPDFILANPPSNPLQIYVSEQTGAPQSCSSSDVSSCQIAFATLRPAVIGASPATVSQQSGGIVFNVNGGFYGTAQNPAITATFNGQLRGAQLPASGATNSTRQLSISIGGTLNPGDLATPGLFSVAVKNATDSSKLAVTNLAVQPNYDNGSSTFIVTKTLAAADGIGMSPSDVAVDPALGLAVVANAGSNSVSLINFAPPPPATPFVAATICTAAVAAAAPCPAAGPASVAVDYIRNIALVVNSTSKTVAVVDLNQQRVSSVISGFLDTPAAVAVNPVTGRALVAMQSKSYGVLLDLANQPRIAGVVSISSGQNPKVAVEPHLNWAVATPGGSPGSLGIVDLSAQICIPMSTLSRTGNVVQVTVQNAVCPGAPANTQPSPLTVQLNDAVFIQSAGPDSTFNGVYTVTAIGPQSNQFSYTEPQISSSAASASDTGGTVNWSEPLFTESLSSTIQGIAIDPETQQAVLADPVRAGSLTFFSLIDQTSSSLLLHTPSGACGSSSSGTPPADAVGPVAAAYNPLTSAAFAVNNFANTLAAVDPVKTTQLNLTAPCSTGAGPAAIAVDPGTNTALIANQTDNSVTILSLGPIRAFSIAETSPKIVVTTSSLSSPPSPLPQTITVIGSGFGSACNAGSTSLQVRLDGVPLSTTCDASTKDRVLTATVPTGPPNFLLNNARRYALEVADSSGNVTNAEDFTVEQSVDVTSACSVAPQPAGVAVDPVLNIAAVSLFGCNSLALIHLDTGIGDVVPVGTNPIGVAVMPRKGVAVTANFSSNNATLVDELSGTPVSNNPSSTGTEPFGAAADPDTEVFAIANASANTVSIVSATGGAGRSISTGSGPVAVGFNYANNEVATAAAGSNALYLSDAGAGSQTSALSINVPTSVAYDPVPDDCGQTSTSTTIAPGCFLANSSTSGFVEVFDPVTLSVKSSFKVGINSTSLAYNYLTGTLVSTNTGSRTLSVADLLAHQIRAVFSLPSAAPQNANLALSGVPQFAVDIHPFRNLAVIADEANGQVLLLPLPH